MPRLRITSDVPVVLHAFRYNSSPPAFLQMYLQSCMRSDITLVLLHSFRLPVVLHAFRYNSSPPEFVQMYLQSCIPSDYLQSCMSSDVPVVLHAFRCNSSPPECVQMYLQSSCIPSDYLQSCMRSDITLVLLNAFRCTCSPAFLQMYLQSCMRSAVPVVLNAFRCTCSPPECVRMYLQSSCMRSDAPVVLMHAFRCTCSPPACLQDVEREIFFTVYPVIARFVMSCVNVIGRWRNERSKHNTRLQPHFQDTRIKQYYFYYVRG